MSQIQGANSAQSLAWLFAPALQQGGPANAPGGAPQGSAQAPAFDPFGQSATPAQGSNTGAAPPFGLDAMSALIAAQERSSGLSPMQQKVFSELDTDGDGKITQSELKTDFGADNRKLADAVMGKPDTNGDGAIDQSEFAAKTKKSLHRHGHHGGPKGLDALLQATQAATSQSTTNSDGSTTTTLTYADGSKVTLNSPAAQTNTGNSVTSGTTQAQTRSNLLEQLIRLQAQLTAPAAPTTATTV